MNNQRRCPRCGEAQLRTWLELNEDEREVVRRLPGSADYSLEERQASHSWCSRCWYESADTEIQT